jgi:hypothetical protein
MLRELWKALDVPSTFVFMWLLGLTYLLMLWHTSKGPFDFRRALLDPYTREVSFSKLGQFVSLGVSTAIIVHQTVKGLLTEWLFIGYMSVWAGAFVASKFADMKQSPIIPMERRQNDVPVPPELERRGKLPQEDEK